MGRASAFLKTLSPEKMPPLDMGDILSIHNNTNHPQLSAVGARKLDEALFNLHQAIDHVQKAQELMRGAPIRLNDLNLSNCYLNSYVYIINVTLDLPKNRLLAAYAEQARGAK
jgi:hypothetical protein